MSLTGCCAGDRISDVTGKGSSADRARDMVVGNIAGAVTTDKNTTIGLNACLADRRDLTRCTGGGRAVRRLVLSSPSNSAVIFGVGCTGKSRERVVLSTTDRRCYKLVDGMSGAGLSGVSSKTATSSTVAATRVSTLFTWWWLWGLVGVGFLSLGKLGRLLRGLMSCGDDGNVTMGEVRKGPRPKGGGDALMLKSKVDGFGFSTADAS